MDDIVLSVSDFVAVFNQTISYAYPAVVIEGELDSFKVSKGRWLYFSLKDQEASIRFFGTVNQMPGPLEDGLMLRVRGVPFLHPLYGFSINVQFMQPVGEGSLKRASQLLETKLRTEGIFDETRKRPLPYPPNRIGLIASKESAAYHDFIKVLNHRWSGVDIEHFDVQVQGEKAPPQIVAALEYFNSMSEPVDVVVITRGGGSIDDLSAFSSELVTRAVALSRSPTLVAIGHEVDLSLAELAADKRASTPSNAAELLTPDKTQALAELNLLQKQLIRLLEDKLIDNKSWAEDNAAQLEDNWQRYFKYKLTDLEQRKELLSILSPDNVLKRGYAIVRRSGKVISSGAKLTPQDEITIELRDASVLGLVKKVKLQ
jgi:exodeoxyribonuclease VII large subunit